MKNKLSSREFNFVLVLAIALGVRQLSMSIIVPFVSTYTQSLVYGTLALGGVALGIFSLSQGIFQIPFGNLADKIGSKKVILIGLGLLILGLLLACISNNAYVYLLSRVLQGSGAITSAAYAWVSQKVEKDKIADSMSLIGTVQGIAYILALGGGPLIISFIDVKDLYIASTILVSIVFLSVLVFLKSDESQKIEKKKESVKTESTKAYLKALIANKSFIGLILLAFVTPFIGMSGFFIIPNHLDKTIGQSRLWEVLTPSVLLAIVFMKISMKFVKKGFAKQIIIISCTSLFIGVIILFINGNIFVSLIKSIFIFTGYTILSTLIPTVVNQMINSEFTGAVNGFINAFIYIGSFLGAVLTGVLWKSHSNIALIIIFILSIIALGIALLGVSKNKTQVLN
ncbi:MFS transporter [Clostridium mediterraneense]|uniref:MFS transporter n=1 Tax=Clostridium mediterraneense TaxID=1805472 RepID=UPI00082CB8B8|nr:MFS transporter [Clostridium mediterraneense]